MGLFPAAFRTEVEKFTRSKGQPTVYPVMVANLPSGTVRLAKTGVDLGGFAEPLIQQWGSIKRAVDPRSETVQSVEVSPTMSDIISPTVSQRFAAEVTRYRRSLRRSPTTIILVSPNLDEADWWTVFSGIIDGANMTSPLLWQLRLRPDDFPLQYGVVSGPPITPPDWPNADPKVYGSFMPLIWGVHNSNGGGNHGFVPTYYVDTVNFRYLVQAGYSGAVTAVYANGSVVATTEYSILYLVINGKQCTVIWFDDDQVDAVITCDVEGFTYSNDATGGTIKNPTDQLAHMCNNFIWGRWTSGPFLSAAPLDSASFTVALDFLTAMGHEGSRWIGGTGKSDQTRAITELETWLASHELRAYWTNGGQLALGVNDHRTTMYHSEWLNGDLDQRADTLSVDFDTAAQVREMTVQYLWNQAENKFMQTVRLQDLSVVDPITRSRSLSWSASRTV